MRRSMHLGDERRLPVEEEVVVELVEEEVFNPNAAKVDRRYPLGRGCIKRRKWKCK